MLVLGIETSCDETGIALYDSQQGLLGNLLHSQVDLHARYGGVVPELASRDHVRKLLPLTRQLLADAGQTLTDLDAIAYTSGPGLLGAVLVGATFGRTLAWSLGIPALGVHHMEAHLLAPLINSPGDSPSASPPLPFVALLVSGGHTQLVRVGGLGEYEMLGESLDDAAGEAFDKVAKMLQLGYPGGPILARLATTGNPERFALPRPMTDRPGLDFSFSGLKTAVLTLLRELETAGPINDATKADVAASFEAAVVDTLVIKCRRALDAAGCDDLILAGGVSANLKLRERLQTDLGPGRQAHYAPIALCTDNGAMVAYTGCQRLLAGEREPLAVTTRARWPMTELTVPGAASL